MMKNRYGRTALQYGCFHTNVFHNTKKCHDAFKLLFKQYILEEIGGEFEIGGLFTSDINNQRNIHKNWEKYVPALKCVAESLQGQKQQPPILHAAILTKAPLHVIQSIIKEFEYSVVKRDSLNRMPIEVALLEENVCWTTLYEVIQATSVAQQHSSLTYTAAQYGLE